MTRSSDVHGMTRRELLRSTGVLAGGALLAPEALLGGTTHPGFQQTPAAPADPVAAIRAQMAAQPIQATTLRDNLTMLAGPGGNVIVLHGMDGTFVVDSFVLPVWPKLKQTIDGFSRAPLKLVIETHWHFDHTDNNQNFRAAGAAILAHANTKKRMSESHDLLGMHFEPSPAAALPTQTFTDKHTLHANGENLTLGYVKPAHTDTDIYIRYASANVLHLGDLFFNGFYPFIDAGTGGNINGMVAAATAALGIVDGQTRIVPGHGPMGDRAALTRYRDMLATIRDRVQNLKASGKTLAEVQAAKPTAEFDAAWGKGMMAPDNFLAIVYGTL